MPETEIVTVKDRYAAVLETGLEALGVEDSNHMAVLLVQQLEADELMPYLTEYRRLSQWDQEPDERVYGSVGELIEDEPLIEGQSLVRRYVTGWRSVQA